jgi:hypothetical protein
MKLVASQGKPEHRLLCVQLRRRRAATYRLAPLGCGHHSDPWLCTCSSSPALSEKMIEAARDAALHILSNGQVPRLEVAVLQALWRRGGADRTLAEDLHQAGGEMIA